MKVLVAGGTGLVGMELLKLLSQRADAQTVALVRRPLQPAPSFESVDFRLFDFEDADAYARLSHEKFDVVFCCLGTTRRKAGSAQAFTQVDFEYPRRLLAAVQTHSPLFCLVSSVGADKPAGLYLKTKFALEQAVMGSGLRYVIVRPSLLLGKRSEFRFGEQLAGFLSRPILGMLRRRTGASIGKYTPVYAHEVAHALACAALENPAAVRGIVLEGRNIFMHSKQF